MIDNMDRFMAAAQDYECLGGAVREQLEEILLVEPRLVGSPLTLAPFLGLTVKDLFDEDLPPKKFQRAEEACELWNVLATNCNINALGMIWRFLSGLPEMPLEDGSDVTTRTLASAIEKYVLEGGHSRLTTDGRVVPVN